GAGYAACLLGAPAEEHAFLLRLRYPLFLHAQADSVQRATDKLWCVAVREEHFELIALPEHKRFSVNFNPARPAQSQARGDLFQATARGSVAQREVHPPIAALEAEIEQESPQPFASQCVVVLRQNGFQARNVIVSGREIGAEQQPVARTDERREDGQNGSRL